MASSNSSGTQTAVVSTVHTLATITTAGTFVLNVDTSNMALIDELTLTVETKVTSTGTTALAYKANYTHSQGIPIKISIPVASINEIVFKLEQTAGTARDFDWEIVEL